MSSYKSKNNHPPIPLSAPPSIPRKEDTNNKLNLTVDTTITKKHSSNLSSPKLGLVPKIITPASPSKSIKSVKSSASIAISPCDSTKSNATTTTNSASTPLRKKKIKLSSKRNSFLHGSPLYGEVSNKMSLLFHAAHNDSNKKTHKKTHTSSLSNSSSSSSQPSSPKNSISSYPTNPIISTNTPNNNNNNIEKHRLSAFSNSSDISSPKSSHSNATSKISNNLLNSVDESTQIINKSHDSTTDSFTSALSNHSISPINNNLNNEEYDFGVDQNQNEEIWDEGMFDTFNFENMIANRCNDNNENSNINDNDNNTNKSKINPTILNKSDKILDLEKARVVSEPITNKKFTGLGLLLEEKRNNLTINTTSNSAPSTRKPSENMDINRKIPPMSNNLSTSNNLKGKSPIPLQLQPIVPLNQKNQLSDKNIDYSENKLTKCSSTTSKSSNILNNNNLPSNKPSIQDLNLSSASPIKTESSSSDRTSRDVSRNGSIHSRASVTNTLQKSYSNNNNKNNNTHKRSSSKGSLHDITTPKSFFKFFGSKKYSSNDSCTQRNSNNHSHSNSQGSDNFSLHSGQCISPISTSNVPIPVIKHNNSLTTSESSGSGFITKINYRTKWEENKRQSSIFADGDHSNNDTPITESPMDTIIKTTEMQTSMNTELTSGYNASKTAATVNSTKQDIYESKSHLNSAESLESSRNSTNRASTCSIPIPSNGTDSSNVPPSSLYSFHHRLSKSNDSTIALSNRSSMLSTNMISLSAGTTPTSANPTITEKSENSSTNPNSPTSSQNKGGKVKSFVKLSSKSIRYSRGSTSLQNKSFNPKKKSIISNSDWDSWDGHSGSFEKIGPVGKKPNPPGQTIPVVTTSNLHSTDENKKSSTPSVSPLLTKPATTRLSNSSLPTLIAANGSNPGFSSEASINDKSKKSTDESFVSIIKSNNTSNSNLLSIYTAPSNAASKLSVPNEITMKKYSGFNINSKYLPKGKESSNKIMITTNFIDYKLMDFNNVNTYPKFMLSIQNMFNLKGDIQIFITDVGLTKDQLGKKLDKATIQTIWDNINHIQNSVFTFYVTTDAKVRSLDIGNSPNKVGNINKVDPHNIHHDRMEETSLYTTSSYTNSINSDSSFDKNLPTPQHLISAKKDSSIDYWNFKDTIERKPSLTRAISITHSSLSGDGAIVQSAPILSRKTSKMSVASGGSSLTSQSQNIQNLSRVSTKTNSSQISSNSDKKLKGSFKVIQPQKPHVDFDNKRATPFVKTNLIAQRFPPPPPPVPSTVPPVPPSSPPQTLQSGQLNDSSPGLNNKQLTNMEKPPTPGFSRTSRNQKKMVSNSIRSLQRSNTQGSLFSSMSSSSGVSIDPFSENKVLFKNFESDDSTSDRDSIENSGTETSDDEDEFGLFAKKPKHTDDKTKSKSENVTKGDSLFSENCNRDNDNDNENDESDDDKEDDDSSFDLFQKKPKSLNISQNNDDDINNEITLTSSTNENDETEYSIISHNSTVISEKENKTHENMNKSNLITKRKKLPPPVKKIGTSYKTTNGDIQIDTHAELGNPLSATSKNTLSHSLDLRPPPEVLYNNLEVFFPKTDLDSLIIDETSPNGNGIGRMKSIRIIAQEASRRTSFRSPLSQKANQNNTERSEEQTKNRIPSKLATSIPTNASLLRRKSTKMWGQKVVEVTMNSKKNVQRVIPRRGKNGEILEFAWIKGELIGIGKFGKVYVAMNVTTGDLIAVKQMSINHKFLNRKETNDIVDTFKAEIDSLKDLDHINIVQYLGFEIKDNTYSIFLEYVSGGSIGHLLRKYGKFEESLVKNLTIQMLNGLNYIHSKGILHRDLKADNLLLEVDGILKISDFGISKRAKDIYTSQSKLNFQGTIFWMAPEIINDTQGVGYNAKVDIWALGCVVLEMFTGERPWSKYEGEGVLYKLGKEKSAPPIKKEIRKEISTYGKHFMKRCFEIDPSKRPTAQTLLNDPFCLEEPGFDFSESTLGKQIHVVEEQEKENLNKRMQSMVRKL